MFCDEKLLQYDTRSYWNEPKKTLKNYYIPDLLPRELQCARQRGAIEEADCDLLVLLVGYSMEPLLQAVCAFQPEEQIFLVLNRKYDQKGKKVSGKRFGTRVQKDIGLLPQSLLNRQSFSKDEIDSAETDDQPAAVFRLLQENLKEPLKNGKKIIIDITGAKKSMVAGAFLYAAYSGIPISYVDFGVYDPDKGKPFGYTCRIGLLREPYEAFRLREWERIGQLYQRYQFRAARQILGWTDLKAERHPGLIDWMEEEEGGERYFTADQIHSAKQLAVVLEMYELWDNGDFKAAKAILDEFSSELSDDVVPWAIGELGDIWPKTSGTTDTSEAATDGTPDASEVATDGTPDASEVATDGTSDASEVATKLLEAHLELKHGKTKPEDSIFNQPTKLLAYVRDELAKIERLIKYNEDYRSAYLRAAGLNEFLLKARLAVCWLNGALQAKPRRGDWGPVSSFGSGEKEAFGTLVEDSREWQIRKALKSTEQYNVKGGNVRRLPTAPCLTPYWSGLALDFDTVQHGTSPVFIKLRGEAIHTHLFIPQKVAKAALNLTKKGCEDFESNWFETFHPGVIDSLTNSLVVVPSWQRLCDLCGIDFLPPAPSAPKKETT